MAATNPDEPRTFITKMVLAPDTRVTISTLATGWDEAARKAFTVAAGAIREGATLDPLTDEVRDWRMVGATLVWS